MSISFFIARRYLRSRRNRGFISFITLFAVIGVAVGVATLIIALSILRGFETTIKENVVSFTAHIQVYGFQGQVLYNPESSIKKVREQYPEVRVMAPYIAREAMVRSEAGIDGILVKGVDPKNDISAAKSHLVEGDYDLRARELGIQPIVIGRRLSEKLRAKIGDRLLVFALGGASLTISQTRVMQYQVRGIYETGMEDFDGSIVYVNVENAQKLFQFESSVSGFDLLVNDVSRVDTLARLIPAALGYPTTARTMFQMYRNLFAWVDLQKSQVPIIISLIIIVAAVNVIGTLLMMVMEKAKDIGILQAIGAKPALIRRIFLSQGVLIGLVGTAAGNILAYGLCWAELTYRWFSLPSGVYMMTHVPIELNPASFLYVSAGAIGLCYLCAFVPSRLATRRDPVSLIRFA